MMSVIPPILGGWLLMISITGVNGKPKSLSRNGFKNPIPLKDLILLSLNSSRLQMKLNWLREYKIKVTWEASL